jgi:hypothetical protein
MTVVEAILVALVGFMTLWAARAELRELRQVDRAEKERVAALEAEGKALNQESGIYEEGKANG